jgi:hypothetical protein
MQIDQILRSQERYSLGGKVRAPGKKGVEGSERLIRRIAVAAVYVGP